MRLAKTVIVSKLAEALQGQGTEILSSEFSGPRGTLPWRIVAKTKNLTPTKYVVYAWTVGHGGRTRSETEYRIQLIVPGESALDFEDGKTILLGLYDGNLDPKADRYGTRHAKVIVAWDPVLHLKPGISASCQVPIGLIEEAYLNGAASKMRKLAPGFEENVIAMRIENLSYYLREVVSGHEYVNAAHLSGDRNPSP